MRSGDVRVLIGSTETVGVGVNVQDRAAALHHLDVPWRPRDIEQREGRIIRQGNKVYGPKIEEDTGEVTNPGRGVKIYQYVQEGSFDEFMWQAVEVKGQAVKALMKRNITARSMDDADPLVLSAAEAKALASGDPMVLRAEQIKNRINTMRLERAAHRSQQENARGQIRRLETVIEGYKDRMPLLELDAQLASQKSEDDKLTVNGQAIEKRADAGMILADRMAGLDLGEASGRIATYAGFDVGATNNNRGHQLTITNPATGIPHNTAYIDEINPSGLMSRLDNLVKERAKTLEYSKDHLEESKTSLELYRDQAGKPFEGAMEMDKQERHLAYVQALLRGDKDPVRPPDFNEATSETVEYATPQLEPEQPAPVAVSPESIPETAAVAEDVAAPEPKAVAGPSPVEDYPAQPETAAVAEDVAEPEPKAVAGPSPVDDAPAPPLDTTSPINAMDWAYEKLDEGQSLIVNIPGHGPSQLISSETIEHWRPKGYDPIEVDPDGNLRVMTGASSGQPIYSVVPSGEMLTSDGLRQAFEQPGQTIGKPLEGDPAPETEAVAGPSLVEDAPPQPETAAVAEDVAAPGPEAVAEPSPILPRSRMPPPSRIRQQSRAGTNIPAS